MDDTASGGEAEVGGEGLGAFRGEVEGAVGLGPPPDPACVEEPGRQRRAQRARQVVPLLAPVDAEPQQRPA